MNFFNIITLQSTVNLHDMIKSIDKTKTTIIKAWGHVNVFIFLISTSYQYSRILEEKKWLSQSSSQNKDSLAPLYFTHSYNEKINQRGVPYETKVAEDANVEIQEKKQPKTHLDSTRGTKIKVYTYNILLRLQSFACGYKQMNWPVQDLVRWIL